MAILTLMAQSGSRWHDASSGVQGSSHDRHFSSLCFSLLSLHIVYECAWAPDATQIECTCISLNTQANIHIMQPVISLNNKSVLSVNQVMSVITGMLLIATTFFTGIYSGFWLSNLWLLLISTELSVLASSPLMLPLCDGVSSAPGLSKCLK